MKRKNKALVTKILLFLMWGLLGYFILKKIYLWQRKKRKVIEEINLSYCLLVSFLITIVPWLIIIY